MEERIEINGEFICPDETSHEDKFQYAAVELRENFRCIMDAVEYGHFERWMNTEEETEPEYEQLEPDQYGTPCIAYGVLIPQYDIEIQDWNKTLDNLEGFTFGTLLENNLYLSEYIDYRIREDLKADARYIPVALLLKTSLDLSKERSYGFGYTVFPLYKDMGILTNIMNRDFLFCLGGIESDFKITDVLKWQDKINEETLKTMATRLY